MKNELVTITGTEISFNNKQLNTATKNIYGYVFGMEKNKFKMAAEMSRILENNLFVDDFDNFETYASKVFDLKKAMAYNYASIGKEWVERNEKGNPTGESILPHDTVDYQITKILALMKVGVEQATEWANDGTLNPFMSVKEIKDIVKEWEKEIAYCENDVSVVSEIAEQESCEGTEEAKTTESMNVPEEEIQDAAEIALQNMIQALTTLKSDERFKDCGEQFKAIEQAIREIETKF